MPKLRSNKIPDSTFDKTKNGLTFHSGGPSNSSGLYKQILNLRFSQMSIKSKRIFRLSKYSSSSDLGFCILKKVSQAPFSLGIVVTKKIGCAVFRNKIKRRIKHVFWEIIKQEKLPATAIIVIARKEAATDDFSQMIKKLSRYFRGE